MNTNENTEVAIPLDTLPQADNRGVIPGEFAGLYQAGFDDGYRRGRETGYQQGFREGYAAVHQGPNNGAAVMSAPEGKPASKTGPRRMLLGMPCVRCRVYLLADETCCPCCKQPTAT